MKWLMIFCASLVLCVALAVFVSAATTKGSCASDQVIMRLTASSNAHGAIWNESGFRKICYTDFFEQSYTEASPHSCADDENLVLKLSGILNAHAAEKGSNAYSASVCYKGLSQCTLEYSGCPSNKAAIVYVSGSSNTHLSEIPNTGYYPVCCKGESGIIAVSAPPSQCYELSEEECENAGAGFAGGDAGCLGHLCTCVWNATQNKCTLEWDFLYNTGGTTDCRYKCVVESESRTECSGGSQILGLVAHAVLLNPQTTSCPASPPALESRCMSSSATVPCGSLGENLPFFGSWQILAGIALTIAIYALLNRRRL